MVAVDGSACSHEAFEVALQLAAAAKARVSLCSVVDASTFAGFAPPSPQMDQSIVLGEAEAKATIDRYVKEARDRGFEARGEVLLGEPAAEIAAYAQRERPDAIVLGTHGRTGLGRVLMGSVAESVLRHARCPVITVREKRKGSH